MEESLAAAAAPEDSQAVVAVLERAAAQAVRAVLALCSAGPAAREEASQRVAAVAAVLEAPSIFRKEPLSSFKMDKFFRQLDNCWARRHGHKRN